MRWSWRRGGDDDAQAEEHLRGLIADEHGERLVPATAPLSWDARTKIEGIERLLGTIQDDLRVIKRGVAPIKRESGVEEYRLIIEHTPDGAAREVLLDFHAEANGWRSALYQAWVYASESPDVPLPGRVQRG